jgi:hypothetical protein
VNVIDSSLSPGGCNQFLVMLDSMSALSALCLSHLWQLHCVQCYLDAKSTATLLH